MNKPAPIGVRTENTARKGQKGQTMANAKLGAMLLDQAIEDETLVSVEEGVRYAFSLLTKGLCLTAWRGQSKKPVFRYLIEDKAHGMKEIAKLVETAKAANEISAKAAAKRKEEETANRGQYVVGVILRHSWGYDQTNIDYYEVTKCSKTGATVEVRPIASRLVKRGEFMSEDVSPAPGKFTGPAFKKRVTSYGVQMEHGWTSIVEASDVSHATHYA